MVANDTSLKQPNPIQTPIYGTFNDKTPIPGGLSLAFSQLIVGEIGLEPTTSSV